MRIIRNLHAQTTLGEDARGAVVAIGNFDGVHRGHRAILERAVGLAAAQKTKAAVLTFEPHPREFFEAARASVNDTPLRLSGFRRKVALLQEAGIELLYIARFDAAFAGLSAEEFAQQLLHTTLDAQGVVTGGNFRFGKARAGDAAALASMGKTLNFAYEAVTPVTALDDKPVSSSAIREALARGDVRAAREMLGRSFDIEGHVVKGQQRGRLLGYPTANIRLDGLFRPRYGVYAAKLHVDGQAFDAVANLGMKPSVGTHEPLLEVHGFAMSQDLYGKRVRVELLDFIRDEQRFADLDSLKAQIAQDANTAQALLTKVGA
jgi:riboflavin kinase/FMN adenylyltransferase